ncbi:hypothetical protein V6N12_034943 [Hibiscus sabdariffa]|uniref:Uncharacterized protein n=1 Tax=Hibiscus sabdariffa TaxID=183260 RepID=A0ABR2BP83_9ROSI
MAGAAIIQLKALLGWNLESLISPKKRVWHLFSALISLKKGSGTCSQLCFLRPKGVVLANNTNGLLHPGVLASGKTCCTLFFTRVFVFKPQLKAVLVWVSAGAPLFSVILEHSTMAPVLIHRVLHHIFVAHESGTVFGPAAGMSIRPMMDDTLIALNTTFGVYWNKCIWKRRVNVTVGDITMLDTADFAPVI